MAREGWLARGADCENFGGGELVRVGLLTGAATYCRTVAADGTFACFS
jgi:hypothetical protein